MSDVADIAAGNRGGAETPHAGVTERLVDAVIAELDRGLPREISVEVMPDKPKDFDLGSREGAGLVHYRSSKYQQAEVNGAGYQIRTITLDVHLIVRGLTGRLTLPNSGVVVSYPTFRAYDDWSRAQAMAGQEAGLINLYYIVAVCQFDGERLKANDYRELVPADDHLAISAKLFGGGSAKDVAGNA